jgi:ABC-type dipeptide/oligopeptide/nickel transport system permease component
MGAYALRRIAEAVPTLLGITIVTFLFMRVGGDPATLVLGETATREAVASYRQEHGLDRPIVEQYIKYMTGVVRGDLGTSVRYQAPVSRILIDRLPATAELGLVAVALAVVIGIPLGILTGVRSLGAFGALLRSVPLLAQAVPGFFLGLVLIMLFSVRLQWLPTGGRGSVAHLVLPALTLAALMVALIMRMTRSSLRDVLRQDYVRTARAKGLGQVSVIFRHALRNALIPVVTVVGLQAAALFSGAVVTETVFAWPGVGRLLVQSVYSRDLPMVQAIVLFGTASVVSMNLAIDLAYALIDPRTRYG